MQYSEQVATVGPHQDESIFPFAHVRKGLLDITRRLNLMTVHFENDVALLQSSDSGGATRVELPRPSPANVSPRPETSAPSLRGRAESGSTTHLAAAFASCAPLSGTT